jgi:hypothetical protein
METVVLHTGLWFENLRERDLERPRHTWEDDIKMDL